MPTIAEEIEYVQGQWAEVAELPPRRQEHPPSCACAEPRVVRDSLRRRSASVRTDAGVTFVPDLVYVRLRCSTCRTSWMRRPPGVLPRRHYLPCVVGDAVAALTIEGATTAETSRQLGVDRRTLRRWVEWTAHVADPALLQRELLDATDEPIVVPPPAETLRREPRGTRMSVQARAAHVLALCVALASALELAPPELGSVLMHYAGPRCASTDQAPAIEALTIPADAQRPVR